MTTCHSCVGWADSVGGGLYSLLCVEAALTLSLAVIFHHYHEVKGWNLIQEYQAKHMSWI